MKQDAVPSARPLQCLLLNSGEERQIGSAQIEDRLTEFRNLVKTDGGLFVSPLGSCELRVFPALAHAILTVKCGHVAVALGMLATGDFGAEILWDEILQQHVKMLRTLGRPVPGTLGKSRPSWAPWMGISIAPAYLDRNPSERINELLSIFAATAFAILEPQHGEYPPTKPSRRKSMHRNEPQRILFDEMPRITRRDVATAEWVCSYYSKSLMEKYDVQLLARDGTYTLAWNSQFGRWESWPLVSAFHAESARELSAKFSGNPILVRLFQRTIEFVDVLGRTVSSLGEDLPQETPMDEFVSRTDHYK